MGLCCAQLPCGRLGYWRKRQSPSRAAGSIFKGAGHRSWLRGDWKCAGRGRLAIACPIWAAPHGLTLWCLSLRPARCLFSQRSAGATLERRSLSTRAGLSIWEGDYCTEPGTLISPTLPVTPMSRTRMMAPSDSRMRAYGCGQIALRSAAHRRLQIDALIPIGVTESPGRFVDRFAKILWRLIAGGGALRTGSPGVALLGWRRGPVDRAAGNCPGPGSKNFKVFRAFDPPL